jgi:hypothetical protein
MPGWALYTIEFNDPALKPKNYTMQNLAMAGGLDTSTLYDIHFEFSTKAGNALPPFDISVACLQFVDQ